MLIGLRRCFNFSFYQKVLQKAPKSLLESSILAQTEPQEQLSNLNSTARTSGSYHTSFIAFLSCETIIQQEV